MLAPTSQKVQHCFGRFRIFAFNFVFRINDYLVVLAGFSSSQQSAYSTHGYALLFKIVVLRDCFPAFSRHCVALSRQLLEDSRSTE